MKILHKYFIIYLLIIISSYFNCFSEQRPAKDVPQNNYNSLTKFYFKKFDSLNDSEKVKKVVNEVVNFVYEGESKFVLYFFKSLYERALQEKNYYFAAQSEISTGFVYGFLGNHQESEKHLKNALELIENDESINTKILSATIFLNLGAVYLELSEIDRALSYLQKCLSLSIKYKLADIENLANLNISTILMDRQQYSRALIYLTKALDYSRKTKNNNNQAGILYSLGVLYSETKQLQKAIDAAEESLKLFTEMNNKIQIGRIQSF